MGAKTAQDIRAQREIVARQFEHELIRLAIVVERRLPNFRFMIHDRVEHTSYTAIVLPTSFDYYEYRLNVGKQRVDMLIVSRHNAAVPVHVISLQQVTKYAPLDVPEDQLGHNKHSQEAANLLLSKYILNFESAHEALAAMTPRTRQRYALKKRAYLRGKIGRPWAS